MMKSLVSTLFLAMSVVSLGAESAESAEDYKRITTKDELSEKLISKRIRTATGWWRINPEGSMEGAWPGKSFSGKWYWRKDRFCREGIFGGQKLEFECVQVEVNGKKVRYTQGGKWIEATIE